LAVLRIRDLVLFFTPGCGIRDGKKPDQDPGSGMEKNPDPESGIWANIPDLIF
jgi:hypothetical protein